MSTDKGHHGASCGEAGKWSSKLREDQAKALTSDMPGVFEPLLFSRKGKLGEAGVCVVRGGGSEIGNLFLRMLCLMCL